MFKKITINDNKSGRARPGSNAWWHETSYEHSYSFFNSDDVYPEWYFEDEMHRFSFIELVEHIIKELNNVCAPSLLNAVLNISQDIKSVVEFGCADGKILSEFVRRGMSDVVGVEGSIFGVEAAKRNGLENIVHHDLREPINLNRKFDLAICCEVAEHIEMPFVSQLVRTITKHSSLVYFSSPDNSEAYLNHPTIAPKKLWINLFKYFDFDVLIDIDPTISVHGNIHKRKDTREDGIIFYKKPSVLQQIFNSELYGTTWQKSLS